VVAAFPLADRAKNCAGRLSPAGEYSEVAGAGEIQALIGLASTVLFALVRRSLLQRIGEKTSPVFVSRLAILVLAHTIGQLELHLLGRYFR
jgi:hypothetical protein